MTIVGATGTPGTWRVADGAAVPFGDATSAWAVAARDFLTRTAKNYHGYITYAELAEEVQAKSGIRTKSQMRNWIGGVLGKAADVSHERGEPALTALCVHQDETIGLGFAYVAQLNGGPVPDDLEQFAADARLECYRFFGATLPLNGGRAALTSKVAAARKRAAKAHIVPPAVCPTCHTQLPQTGRCDGCL